MTEYYVDPGNGYADYSFHSLKEAIEYADATNANRIDMIDGYSGEVFDFLYRSDNWEI